MLVREQAANQYDRRKRIRQSAGSSIEYLEQLEVIERHHDRREYQITNALDINQTARYQQDESERRQDRHQINFAGISPPPYSYQIPIIEPVGIGYYDER